MEGSGIRHFILLIFLASKPLLAENTLPAFDLTELTTTPIHSSRISEPQMYEKLPGESYLQLSLGAESAYYLSQDTNFFDKGETQGQISSLLVAVNYSWRGFVDGVVQFKNRLSLEEETNYMMPRQLYAGWQWDREKFWIGRKWYQWSEADELFRRGLFQGRFMEDKLTQESYGLTGFFYEKWWRDGHILLFGSPVFIPEFGPEFELREGKFSSPNPFFRPPSQVVNFLGVDTPLRYQIVYPNESEIAMNPSYGFSMHQEWGNWFARSSYSYKPMNQLLMGVEFYFQHAEAGDQSVSVQVYPRLQYHQLLALEAGFAEIGGWKTWVSWLSEVPENEEVPIEWTYQRTSPSRLVTFYVGRDLASSPLGETQAYLCFSKLEGGDISDGGEFTARYSLFEKRYQFHEVAALGIQGGRSSLFKRNLRWNFRFAFDQAQRGVLWLSDLSYQMANHWQISASLDFLGLVGSEKAQVVDGFLGQYRANDRVQLKVEYVF